MMSLLEMMTSKLRLCHIKLQRFAKLIFFAQIKELSSFFLYLAFLSRTFTIHKTAGEGGGYLFNSSLPLPPASQTLRH